MKAEHKQETEADEEATTEEEEQEAGVHLVTYVNNILHSIFSNVEVYINNQQVCNSNRLYAHKSYIFNNFSEPSLNTRDFCTARATTMKNFLMKLWKRLCLNLFSTRRMKMLSRPDGFMLYGKLGVDFFSTSELLYPNMNIRLRLIRARPHSYMISDNPNVSLGIVDC